LRILATSREALALTGESVWQVPPLAMPEPSEVLPSLKVLRQYEAVSLFIERARAGHPSFAFSAENARPIVKICHHLDGIPLAIELAAARVRVLSAEQVAERLSDRFKLLTGGNRAAEPRQQTLRAALDWSHDLLSEKEKILLRRLAIFEGGWTLEAAEAICAGEGVEKHDVLASLARLVEKSFVIARVQGQRARYDFLKTIRQYSLEKLQEAGELRPIRLLHLDYFLHLAEEAEPQMVRSEQKTWLDRLEAEHGNLREALAWCQSEKTEIEKGMRLVGALWWFWWIHGYFSEGRSYLESLLMMENTKEHKRSRAKALTGRAVLPICRVIIKWRVASIEKA
jgi:non-specific serine/threonine protein kinase